MSKLKKLKNYKMIDNIGDLERVFGKLVEKYETMSSDATLEELTDLTREIEGVDKQYQEDQMKNNIAGFNENLKIELKFQNKSDNEDPSFAYKLDSGFDLRASEELTIKPKEVGLVPTRFVCTKLSWYCGPRIYWGNKNYSC